MEKKIRSLWEKLKGGGQRNGPTTTIHPTLNSLATQHGKAGLDTIPLEELTKASFEQHLYNSIAESERLATNAAPEILELTEQHQDDRSNQTVVVKKKTARVEEHKAKSLELFVGKRSPLELRQKQDALKRAEPKAKEKKDTYINECAEHARTPDDRPLRKVSPLGFAVPSASIFIFEAVANHEAFLPVFRSNQISNAVIAVGCSLGVTLLAKFCGNTLASFGKPKLRKPLNIALFGIAALSTIGFCLLVGGTRAFSDPSHPLPSWWAEIAAMMLNGFLFICMTAITWAYQTKKATVESVNAALESKLKAEKLVDKLQAEVDALELAAVDKEISIEDHYRDQIEEAENFVRTQGLELAKKVGPHHADLANIHRQSLVVSAALKEAIWGIRLHHQLAQKQTDPKLGRGNDPIPLINPMLYQLLPIVIPDQPNGDHSTENSSSNPNTHENAI